MKRIFAVSLSLLILSGCSTTPNQMRDSGPHEVHTSFKEPKDVFLCVADAWEDYLVVNSRETADGYSMTGLLDGDLKYMADIDKTEQGSSTKLYKFMSVAIGRDYYFGSAAKCQ